MVTNADTIDPFIFLYITEECQLRCKHCYVGERLERGSVMPLSMISSILRSMQTLYGHRRVYFLGGEPTLHPEFAAALRIAKDEGYRVIVTSNGIIPQRRWDDIINGSIDELSFSLDGAKASTHEFLRGRNTFPPLLTSIQKSVSAGILTRLICTITKHNETELEELAALCDELQVRTLSLHYFTPTGNGQGHKDLQLSPAEWRAFGTRVEAIARRSDVTIFYPPAFCESEKVELLTSRGYRGCTARNLERLAFFPDGRCYICSAFFDTDLHYGRFVDGRIVPRMSLRTELSLVNEMSPSCGGCKVRNSCRGGCAAYDHFDRTHPSATCSGEIVPICPLWSTAAGRDADPTVHFLR